MSVSLQNNHVLCKPASDRFACGHPRTNDNMREGDYGPRCATCRREIEREASRRYRARKAAA